MDKIFNISQLESLKAVISLALKVLLPIWSEMHLVPSFTQVLVIPNRLALPGFLSIIIYNFMTKYKMKEINSILVNKLN